MAISEADNLFTSGVYFFATRIPSNPYFQGLAWWEMTMCVFLCVLFKADGWFTLAEMVINSLERMGGTAGTQRGTLPSLPACCGHT